MGALADVGLAFANGRLVAARIGRRLAHQVLRVGDDRRTVLPDEPDEFREGLGHHVLRPVDERDDGVGRTVGPLDEIRVQCEHRAVEARQEYHGGPSLERPSPGHSWALSIYRPEGRPLSGFAPRSARRPRAGPRAARPARKHYRFRFTRSCNSSSEVLITLEFAWN